MASKDGDCRNIYGLSGWLRLGRMLNNAERAFLSKKRGPAVTLILSFIIGWFPFLSTDSPKPDPTVAVVAGEVIRLSEVRTLSHAEGLQLSQALHTIIDEALLAAQAAFIVPGATKLPRDRATRARAVEAAMLNPAVLCSKIPHAMRRQWYDETRWRFVAPPAWTVEDTQLICCQSPRKCREPAAAECLKRRREEARRLPAAIHEGLSQAQLEARFSDVYVKRYTFYYDPSQPDAKMDWRLQKVDRPIAEAVSTLSPGQRTKGAISTRFGYHALRLLQARPGIQAPFEDPRTQALLRTELCPTLLVQQRKQLLKDLRNQTPIKLHPNATKLLGSAPRPSDGADGRLP